MLVRFSAAIAAVLALAVSAPATAAPDGGTVSGTLELPKAEKRGDPPVRNRGFFERMPNSVLPPRTFDPRPELVVVLEGGEPHPDDTEPPRREVEYELIGESFKVPVLPVIAGTEVELVNGGKRSPRLYSPDDSELLDGAPVDPNGTRSFEAPKGAVRAIEIRSRDSAHLSGRILSVPHAYYARADEQGKFKIEGVPAGTWTVRVWHRDGWMKGPSQEVEVKKRRTANVTIQLPGKAEAAADAEED